MKTSDLFPSKYWRADDLPEGGKVTLTIDSVGIEEMELSGDDKPVLFFQGEKPMVLNRTNCTTLEEAFGDDTDAWEGKRVEMRREKTTFAGKRVPCLRLYPIRDGKPAAAEKPADLGDLDDANAALQQEADLQQQAADAF